MQPDAAANKALIEAFQAMVKRIEESLLGAGTPKKLLPVKMFVAGGLATHLYTASRMTDDVDATFSHRMLLPENLEVVYRDTDGRARLLYFDRQYNDTFGLMHEDAHADSQALLLESLAPGVVEVRLLAPVDLAVSKLSRFADHDRDDIAALARAGLIDAIGLRRRADEALQHYIGNQQQVKLSIDLACNIVKTARDTKNK